MVSQIQIIKILNFCVIELRYLLREKYTKAEDFGKQYGKQKVLSVTMESLDICWKPIWSMVLQKAFWKI